MTSDAKDGRMWLTIVGGYLGSGKTTWLRHQLFAGAFGQVHVLVNEAAETAVDDTLLMTHATGLTLLAGGCSCCVGKDELVAALRALCDERSRRHSDDQRLEHIVLETSGLADPAAILSAIREDSLLVHHIRVTEIIVLVDSLNAFEQLRSEHLGRAQIEAADRIILTKADAVLPETLANVVATARQLNPAAAIEASVMGEPYALPGLRPGVPFDLPALAGNGDAITPTRIELGPEVDWAAFSVWLSALLYARGDDLVRVKGVVATPAGPLLLQAVRKSVQPPEVLPPEATPRTNQIVFIGRGYAPEDLRRSLTYFTGADR